MNFINSASYNMIPYLKREFYKNWVIEQGNIFS